MTKIVNKSLISGKFPDTVKIAKVILIHKAGDNQNISHYRPIPILPMLSKVYEKIVLKQMLSYHNKFGLNNNQYGFQPSEYTTQVILDHLQYIHKNHDYDHIVLSFFWGILVKL